MPAPRDSPTIARYFRDYERELVSYLGMMTITRLNIQVIAGVTEKNWDLPRP